LAAATCSSATLRYVKPIKKIAGSSQKFNINRLREKIEKSPQIEAFGKKTIQTYISLLQNPKERSLFYICN